MKRKLAFMAGLLLLGSTFVGACGGVPVAGDPDSLRATPAMPTNDGSMGFATQSALQTEVVYLRTQVQQRTPEIIRAATSTTVPPTATFTPLPTATETPIPPTATPTVTRLQCNVARFVADVTIPDETVMAPGHSFSKTWRLQNLGACAWTTEYALVFFEGEAMSGPAGLALPGNVLPGQMIDLSVDLAAPSRSGSYRGYWKLRDARGIPFGLGPRGEPFYVDIRVEGSDGQTSLDFADSYCQAAWTSSAGNLPCPGEANDSRGFVRRTDKPTLENGFIEDAQALLTHPQMITDGIIRGKYPAVQVGLSDHFSAVIGCAYRADACDVVFQLDYQIGDGSIQNLAAWRQVYDGQYDLVDVDLSRLAGQEVSFILTILANGSPSQDRALWLEPHIVRK